MEQKYIIYCRKSSESEERQVLSIEAQMKELEELRKRLNLPISEVLTEFRSAKYPGRPIFARAMERVSRGEVKGIICWKLDRLARNPLDGAALVWALDQGKVEEIITPYNHLLNNSNDKFLMQLEFGMAKKYVDDLSDNVRRGNRMKLEKGWLPGKPPLGYMNEPEERTIVPDPERFHIVRKTWELLLEGVSINKISRAAADKLGLRSRSKLGNPVSKSVFYTIFTNPFYYGLIARKEGTYQGKHVPMITEDEYWKAQQVLRQKGKPRPKEHIFAYTGLIKCGECGCSIVAEEKVNRYGSHYTYYHCTKKKQEVQCSQKSIEVNELEAQIKAIVERIHIPEKPLAFTLDYLEKEQKEDQENQTMVWASIQKAHGTTVRKLDTLNQMRLGELVGDEEYLGEKRKLLDEKIRLEESLKDIKNGKNTVHDLTAKAFRTAYEALGRFEKGSPEVRKAVIRDIGSNLLLKDKKLSIDVLKPFVLIEKSLNALSSKKERLEPKENVTVTGRFGLPRSQFLILSALADDIRTFFRDKIKEENFSDAGM